MLIVENKNSVLTVRLNRPDVKNAFDPGLIAKLTETFRQIPASVRAVVLAGEGSVFCAGADLNWMKSMVNFSFEQNVKDSEELFEMFNAIRECPVPVIAKVQGAAFGGALGLIACSDVVICEDRAQLCFSEVKLGLVPAVISSFILEKVSRGQVQPFMMSGKIFTAEQAASWGLVHGIGASQKLDEMVEAWVKTFKEAGPEAIRETKKLVQKIGLSPQFFKAETTKVIAERRVSPEGQEGLKSFLEKRSAGWKA